jgi:hypothetical protein
MQNPPPRREYRRPRLTVYGTVETVTLTNATMNTTDMMSGTFSMT